MLLTSTTLILFLIVIVAALGVGIFSKRNEVYILGIVLLLFIGLWTLQDGVSYQTGLNETSANNTTITTYVYEETSTPRTTGLGLLFVVIAAGLFLHFYKSDKEEKQKKADSIEIDD